MSFVPDCEKEHYGVARGRATHCHPPRHARGGGPVQHGFNRVAAGQAVEMHACVYQRKQGLPSSRQHGGAREPAGSSASANYGALVVTVTR